MREKERERERDNEEPLAYPVFFGRMDYMSQGIVDPWTS